MLSSSAHISVKYINTIFFLKRPAKNDKKTHHNGNLLSDEPATKLSEKIKIAPAAHDDTSERITKIIFQLTSQSVFGFRGSLMTNHNSYFQGLRTTGGRCKC